MKKKYGILLCLLLATTLLFADNIKFTASVSKTEVGTGEQFEVTFSVNGNGDRFNPPDFSGFQVLSGPNMSNSVSYINGSMSASTSISYVLMAANTGDFTIGPGSIIVDGHTLKTSPIKIKVVKGRPVPQNAQPAQAQTNAGGDVTQGNTSDISKLLFIRAQVDKMHAYIGEQLTVNYKLYVRVTLLGAQMDKAPDLNGFYSEDIGDKNQKVVWKTETLNGARYNVATIKQTILFPQHAGNIVIDPLAMTFAVRTQAQSRDIFDQFFGSYKDAKYSIKSPPVTIHVLPLPETGKPAGFGGAVGNFSISATVDKKELKANESLNYTLKVAGAGNLKLLNNPAIIFPLDFEKYDPKVVDSIKANENGVSGNRRYNYLLIPRHQGDYTIAPVEFSYFNPVTKRYVSLSIKAFPVKVNKGINEGNATTFNAANQQDIKLLNKDIRYIKTGDLSLNKDGEEFYGSGWYYLLLLLGPALFAGAFAYRRWDEKNNSDLVLVKSRKAAKIAAKHLANAGKQLTAGDSKAFYEAIFKGLYGYLSDKLNIPAANLDKEYIAAQLKARNIDDAVIKQLIDTIDLCEMARFAPVSFISEQEVFDKSKNIISEIEDKI
jgi:hypothetical protein